MDRLTRPMIPMTVRVLLPLLFIALLTSFAVAQGEPTNGKQLWDQAEALNSGGDKVGAFKVYNAIVTQFPTDSIYAPRALLRMALVRYDERNTTEALAYTIKMTTDYPDSNVCQMGYGAFYLTALYLIFQNNPQATVDVVKSHIDHYAPHLDDAEWCGALNRVAQAYLKLNKPKDAQDFLIARTIPHRPDV
ncbi:MAG: tetratricopeptide repeat protein, partial [Armatimonadota bacterium]